MRQCHHIDIVRGETTQRRKAGEPVPTTGPGETEPNWRRDWDEAYEDFYYHHKRSGDVRWDPPPPVLLVPSARSSPIRRSRAM